MPVVIYVPALAFNQGKLIRYVGTTILSEDKKHIKDYDKVNEPTILSFFYRKARY